MKRVIKKQWLATLLLGAVLAFMGIGFISMPLLSDRADKACGISCAFCGCSTMNYEGVCGCNVGENNSYAWCDCFCECTIIEDNGEFTTWICDEGRDFCSKTGGGDPWDPWPWPPYAI